jgi:glycosyltransferase involved in cell wall biosynthesis
MTSCRAVTGSLLLELAVPFHRIGGVLHVEAQAHNGMARWLDNFDRIAICAPRIPESLVDATMDWKPAQDLLDGGRLTLHELPWGYHPRDHLRHRRQVRAIFRRLIPQNTFLCFSNLGWAGAWGNVAADEARRAGRSYAVWLDWELHVVPSSAGAGRLKRVLLDFRQLVERRLSIHAIRHAALGLFHGRTVYDAYAPISRNPHVVHDVHLKKTDVIDDVQLQQRLARNASTIRIGYVGRVHEMKGPIDWIAAIAQLAVRPELTGRLEAIWLGNGPLLEPARTEVRRLGLEHVISFPGGESDRVKVVSFFRGLDLFVFCHKTPESPRCLLEALMAGVPIIGYWSSFAEDLVSAEGGGDFVPIGDIESLANTIMDKVVNTALRQQLSLAARRSGTQFSDDVVFEHRSALIKKYLEIDHA